MLCYIIDSLFLGQSSPLQGPEGDLPLATADDAAFLRWVELHRQHRLCGTLKTTQKWEHSYRGGSNCQNGFGVSLVNFMPQDFNTEQMHQKHTHTLALLM